MLLRWQLKAIADPELGQDMGRTGRIGFELLPKAPDEHAQVLHVIAVRGSPYLAEKVPVGQHLAGMGHEMAQQLEFLG